MAQQHLETPGTEGCAGDAVAAYLREQATEFLRSLRQHRECGGAEGTAEAARALRHAARRVSGTLHTFRPLLDPDWSDALRPELAWLSATLGQEHQYAFRLDRLLSALHRLSGTYALPAQALEPAAGSRPTGAGTADRPASANPAAGSRPTGAPAHPAVGTRPTGAATDRPTSTHPAVGSSSAGAERVGTAQLPRNEKTTSGNLTVGAAKAGALLERQLTLARTRAHSTALQALGSSRFHAVADNVALLASDVPLRPATTTLQALAETAESRLTEAVNALPLHQAGHPYNAEALVQGLSADPAPPSQDAPWHHVRLLLRLHRYAQEVLTGAPAPPKTPSDAATALDRHRDAAEAAAAAAHAARTPRIAPATAYALGVLHADQRHEVEAARFAFQRAWQKESVRTP
ncbi:CHAD domain-containing protein [Streptomyces sp. NPDC046821]|uniref:CHAD domain-containing protein n=1 Tax=Streptomyces sp. NPDC046821 TaxID=3154702 RepID=UPI0033EF9471